MLKAIILTIVWCFIYFIVSDKILMCLPLGLLAFFVAYLEKRGSLSIKHLFIITIIGFVYISTYYFNYQNLLSPYGDDALFLSESKSEQIQILNIFPLLLNFLSFLIQPLNFNDQDFLFLVYIHLWILYAWFISLSYKVFIALIPLNVNFKLYSTFLLGLYLIQWSFIHVYRDLFLFFLIFIAIDFILKKRFLPVIVLVIPIFFLRGGTFMLVFAACVLFRYRDFLLNGSTAFIKLTKILLIALVTLIMSTAFSYIVPFMSRFGNIEGNDSNATLVSFLDKRTNFFTSNEQIHDQVTYKIMQQNWIVKSIALPSVNIVSPVKFSGLSIKNKRVSFKFNITYMNNYLDYSNIFQVIHIIVMSVFLPFLVVNFKEYFSYSSNTFAFVIITIIFMVSVSFISFVPRHRVLFLVPLAFISSTRFENFNYHKIKPFVFLTLSFLIAYNLLY